MPKIFVDVLQTGCLYASGGIFAANWDKASQRFESGNAAPNANLSYKRSAHRAVGASFWLRLMHQAARTATPVPRRTSSTAASTAARSPSCSSRSSRTPSTRGERGRLHLGGDRHLLDGIHDDVGRRDGLGARAGVAARALRTAPSLGGRRRRRCCARRARTRCGATTSHSCTMAARAARLGGVHLAGPERWCSSTSSSSPAASAPPPRAVGDLPPRVGADPPPPPR